MRAPATNRCVTRKYLNSSRWRNDGYYDDDAHDEEYYEDPNNPEALNVGIPQPPEEGAFSDDDDSRTSLPKAGAVSVPHLLC